MILSSGQVMFAKAFAMVGQAPDKISQEEYRSRQARFLSNYDESDVIILCASPETTHSNDVHHPYRTQSDLLYMTGWTEPDAVMCAEFTLDAPIFEADMYPLAL